MSQVPEPFSEEVLNALKDLSEKIKGRTEISYDQMQDDNRYHISVIEKLGGYGWTIHGNITPNDPREWINIIESKGEAEILKWFSENDIDEMFDEMRHRYHTAPESLYLERASENYYLGHYTEAAFFFLALMNYRINIITPDNIRKLTKQCEEGLKKTGEEKYDSLSDRPFFRLFLVRDYIPSFYAFATRTFVDGDAHKFDTGTEPDYLNRNWLMHGRMTRLVKRFECVQLINAFHTLAEIEEAIDETAKTTESKTCLENNGEAGAVL